ncbi:MAG TPA: DNA primase [Candidatus Saccharimonadales bacterium]|nr:DNA primase [Candidatus Saccharimonadales bacterium]
MDAVEEIKSRLFIEDVIGQYVLLKRAGRNFKGLSPFNSEKTPSFIVSPEKQIWHDFSSGKGGNIFSFVMEMEGLDFKGALELLARKAGVELSQYSGSGGDLSRQKERLYLLLDKAAKFYQVQLKASKSALDYLIKERKFSKTTVLKFRLGYSPNTGDALLRYLEKAGFSVKEMRDAGVVTKNYQQPNDMFRGRLMVPLTDTQGRVVGFTARILDGSSSSKYVNTPQTLLYDKSRQVYGLDLAKVVIRKTGYVIVCEGNLDVIASSQADVEQVVATAGTAMTSQQLKLISSLTKDVRLAFDQDMAGQTATERAIVLASQADINLSVISTGGFKDPDELIRKDISAWQKAVDEPTYALDWLVDAYSKQLNLQSVLGKRKFTDAILPIVSKLSDPVEKDHYLSYIAELIKTAKEALVSKADSMSKKDRPMITRSRRTNFDQTPKEVVEQTKAQDHLIALAVFKPFLRHYLDPITPQMLTSPEAGETLGKLKTLSVDMPDDKLKNSSDYAKMLVLLFEAVYTELDETELDYEARLLQGRLIVKYVKQQKNVLSKALSEAGQDNSQQLLKQAKELDDLLRYQKEV